MKNNRRCQTLLLAAVFVATACGRTTAAIPQPAAGSTGTSKNTNRPNIVWLTTEDNSSRWYRLYHAEGATMPNVEWMANNGLVFNNAYSCAPVCSTARSTIISGCYASRLGAQYHRAQVKVKLPDGLETFPTYLRQAGYYTTNNRKTDYNFVSEEIRGTWDESSAKATYRNRAEGQPFFHVQNYTNTHESQLFGDLPANIKNEFDPEQVKVFPYHPDTELFRTKYAQYLAMHQNVDRLMGQFIQQLDNDGLLDDTFIFHYGDHGGVLPGSKGYAREDGLHVAMVVYVPKNFRHLVPADPGSRVDGFVEFVDLSATVLNLAGVTIPDGIDGKPFLGAGVSLDELNQRQTAMGYAERFDEKYDMVRFLRHGNYSYHRNYQPFNFDGLYNEYRYLQPAYQQWRELYDSGKLNEAQAAFFRPRPAECLYDLENDPHEVNNLAGDPRHQDALQQCRQVLNQRLKLMPDVGFIPEPVFCEESEQEGFAYAVKNRDRIQRLIAVADLQLVDFETARPALEAALTDEDPLVRYWGLIVGSSFGEQADSLTDRVREMAANEREDLLVRCRAAEFMGLNKVGNPADVLTDVLLRTDDPIMANLIFNTAVLLKDNNPDFSLDWERLQAASWMNLKDAKKSPFVVQRRILQFLGIPRAKK